MGCNKNAPNFSFHEHSCYIYIFNIEKITRCFTYIPNLILNSETDFLVTPILNIKFCHIYNILESAYFKPFLLFNVKDDS